MLDRRVSRAAYLLGYAGLLPQIGAVALTALARTGPDRHGFGAMTAFVVTFGYGSLILSFLGGIWWGFAICRPAGQAALATVAVVPSLVPLALLLLGIAAESARWPLVLLGLAIILTLLVDLRLSATGEAPEGWMSLRAPLSLGLGGLTILAGLLSR